MNVNERVLVGALKEFGGPFVLSRLRRVLAGLGAVYTTAPEQVVGRAEELGLLVRFSSGAKKALAVAAHFCYGMASGAVFGALRTERGGPGTEAAVGTTLGVLSWGAGWAGWLPIAGVHPAPWTQKTPRALLPVLDQATFGAAWGRIYWAPTRRQA
jgi:hypothetical protein